MEHSFNVRIAEKFGVYAAIIIRNFVYWIALNIANGKHFHDGRYWTYNSYEAMAELFPYLTKKQIRTTINKLVEAGILIRGNYNKAPFDHTTWYAFTDEGLAMLQEVNIDLPKWAHPRDQMGTPIPDNKHIDNINIIPHFDQNSQHDDKTALAVPSTQCGLEGKRESDFETEFAQVWKMYPNKKGRAKSLKEYEKARRGGVPREQVEAGVRAYAEYCKRCQVEQQYIKHGDTWFRNRCWEDDYSDIPAATTNKTVITKGSGSGSAWDAF